MRRSAKEPAGQERQGANGVQWRRDFQAGLAASIVVHILVLVCMLYISPAAIPDAEDPVVSVTLMVLPQAAESQTAPEPAKQEPPSPQPAPPNMLEPKAPPGPNPQADATPGPAEETRPAPPTPTDPTPKMTDARAFYAATILARPENRSARDALKTLSPSERNEQICDTEAMEQIRRADAKFRPDRLIAYALENIEVDGDTLHAAGAAFRSAHRWFRLTFDCTLDAKRNTVTAFRFLIGDPIPSSRWNDLQLER